VSLRAELSRHINDPLAMPDPGPLYARLVDEAPVLDLGRVWVVAGYPEIQAVLTHPGAVMNPASVGLSLPRVSSLSDVVAAMLPMRDGEDHTRLRRLATTAFSARRTAQLKLGLERCVDELLDAAVEQGEFDFVADIALPLPVALSCDILDVPAADRPRIATWARLVTQSLLRPPADPDSFERDFAQFCAYVAGLCAARATAPREDLISQLTAARATGVIDDAELLAFVVMLFANGLETLTAGLSVAALQVLTRPDLKDLLRREPESATAVFTECLRLHNPVRASARAFVEPLTVGTQTIPSGSVAILLYAAANRDPRRFADPDRLDPHRADGRHVAFGHGPHHCLGAPLSLVAGAAVLRRLAASDLVADRAGAAWGTEFATTGLRCLPVHRAVETAVA
jgi:cytochrome P450